MLREPCPTKPYTIRSASRLSSKYFRISEIQSHSGIPEKPSLKMAVQTELWEHVQYACKTQRQQKQALHFTGNNFIVTYQFLLLF